MRPGCGRDLFWVRTVRTTFEVDCLTNLSQLCEGAIRRRRSRCKRRFRFAVASGRIVSIALMTIVLAIAVVLLAAGLIYALLARQPEPVEQPDLTPAIQE